MKPAARRYVLMTMILAGVLAGGTGLLNYFVDPYNLYGRNRLGVYISAERESKATDVSRYPHDALLLGNSRIAMIPAARLQGFRFFNAAFGGGTAEEACYFLQHFAAREKLVVLGIDFGQGDPPQPQGDIFAPRGPGAVLGNVLNLQTAEYSVRTAFDHWQGRRPSMSADGSFIADRWFELYDRPDPARAQWQLAGLKQALAETPVPGRAQMTFYARIADLLRQRGIACVVFIPPMHEELAEFVRGHPKMPEWVAWRRDLGSIFPHVVDLSLGPDDAATNFFQADWLHFKPEAGARMLNTEVLPLARQILPAAP